MDESPSHGGDLLKIDPWDVVTLRAMAEACAALHHNEVELVYLKQALSAESKNVEVNRHCARPLGRMGQFDQAIACWHRIEKLRGKDDEAAKIGGRPPATKARQSPTLELKPEEAPRETVRSPQQKLEQAIALDPKNASNYLELVELWLESNQFNTAEAVLSRAIAACGDQRVIVEQLDRVRSLRAEQ